MGKKNLFPKLEGTKLDDFTPTESVNGLEIIDIKEGQGKECPEHATIRAHYTGALCKNGVIFQSSHDSGRPLTFGLHEVIAGWGQGVPGMKVGGIRRLLIPSSLAYGTSSPDKSIPKNSDLVFDIELIKIV